MRPLPTVQDGNVGRVQDNSAKVSAWSASRSCSGETASKVQGKNRFEGIVAKLVAHRRRGREAAKTGLATKQMRRKFMGLSENSNLEIRHENESGKSSKFLSFIFQYKAHLRYDRHANFDGVEFSDNPMNVSDAISRKA